MKTRQNPDIYTKELHRFPSNTLYESKMVDSVRTIEGTIKRNSVEDQIFY